MPRLSYEVASYLQHVRDTLSKPQDRGARARLAVPSNADPLNYLVFEAKDGGTAANAWTVEVVVPAGTSALAVSVTGTAITIALDVTIDVPTVSENSLALIQAAVLTALGADSPIDVRLNGPDSSEERTTAFAEASLSGGLDKTDVLDAAPIAAGYLRAQDMATVVELLQESFDASLTATGGTTTTAVVASLGTANRYRGATVTFAADTTTVGLRGVSATVLSSAVNTLTFSSTLPAAVANTDTFTISLNLVNDEIDTLRQGGGRADAPRGSVYGETRIVLNALNKLHQQIQNVTTPVHERTLLTTTVGYTASDTLQVAGYNATMRIDEYKGLTLVTAGGDRRVIVSNDETSFRFTRPVSVVGGDALTVRVPTNTPDHITLSGVHPGGHPDSSYLAFLLGLVQAVVEASALPA